MNKDLDLSLIESLKSEGLTSLVSENTELAFDAFLKDGIAKEIPIFSTLVSGYNALTSIREKLFARKIYRFLAGMQNTTREDRLNFINKMNRTHDGENRTGEALLLLLERLDNLEKPKLIGTLFTACINKEIEISELLHLCNIIERLYIDHLLALKKSDSNEGFSSQERNGYLSCGLMTMKIKGPSDLTALGINMAESPLLHDDYTLKTEFTNEAYLLAEILFGAKRPTLRVTPC